MKTYEAANLVELGSASELILGESGEPPDNPPQNPQEAATLMDIDE